MQFQYYLVSVSNKDANDHLSLTDEMVPHHLPVLHGSGLPVKAIMTIYESQTMWPRKCERNKRRFFGVWNFCYVCHTCQTKWNHMECVKDREKKREESFGHWRKGSKYRREEGKRGREKSFLGFSSQRSIEHRGTVITETSRRPMSLFYLATNCCI